MSGVHVADTGFVVALGQPSNERYQAVEQFARRNDVTFVLPERVYEELYVDDSTVATPPVKIAIEEGWMRIADPLEHRTALVSRTMDAVQRYIANADDRPADEVEQADAALAGVVAQAFVEQTAEHAYVYTTDVAAGRGVETAFACEGYGDAVTFVNGFRFVEDLVE